MSFSEDGGMTGEGVWSDDDDSDSDSPSVCTHQFSAEGAVLTPISLSRDL